MRDGKSAVIGRGAIMLAGTGQMASGLPMMQMGPGSMKMPAAHRQMGGPQRALYSLQRSRKPGLCRKLFMLRRMT